MMTVMVEHTIARTATTLLADERLSAWSGLNMSLWLYEGHAERLRVQQMLSEHGITARVRSAYKPLLHFFLEELDLDALVAVSIHYPVIVGCDPKRFLLEAYPLARLLKHCEVTWVPVSHATSPMTAENGSPTALPELDSVHRQLLCPSYQVSTRDLQGNTAHHVVEAPNAWVIDHLKECTLCPTGMLRVTNPVSGQSLCEQAVTTEIEHAFAEVMQWVCQHDWGQQEPYFERLEIRVEVPGAERTDVNGVLMMSTLEALHEDLYFSILEFFQKYSGRVKGDRGLQPGQIVPDIRMGTGPVHIKIVLHPAGSELPPLQVTFKTASRSTPQSTAQVTAQNTSQDLVPAHTAAANDLSESAAALSVDAIEQSLKAFDGTSFVFVSRQGRAVKGVLKRGELPAIVLTGGQHANEPSGIVGALRGGQWLDAQSGSHFALVPLENPDGYQLQGEYVAIHPQHIHHAARYTGLGDDLEYREHAPWYETAARMHALDQTGAQLHLSLHGYPAHEWTRPFTGYLPRGFELWSIPKGFFLIVRYQASYEQIARQWLEMITHEIAAIPGLAAFNQEQLEIYTTHAGSIPFEVHHGIACILSQNDQQVSGLKLVTEFPDETLYGESFQFAQRVQTETVRIAATAWWQLNYHDTIRAKQSVSES
jgi:hypothetical protein